MSPRPSLNNAMSSTTHPNTPLFPAVYNLDELDGLGRLHQLEHPTFRQPPPAPTAVYTMQNMLLPPSTGPFPSLPPPLIHSRSPPYARIPLPNVLPNLEGGLTIHTVLHNPPSSPLLGWDVRTHPNTVVCELSDVSFPGQPYNEQRHLTGQWHNQPASIPSLDRIFIYTNIFPDRPIIARPSDYNSSFVTIYDVLVAVHRAIGCAQVGDDTLPKTGRGLLGARTMESGDLQRQRWGAESGRRVDPSWSQWEWGGLVPVWGEEGWRLVLL